MPAMVTGDAASARAPASADPISRFRIPRGRYTGCRRRRAANAWRGAGGRSRAAGRAGRALVGAHVVPAALRAREIVAIDRHFAQALAAVDGRRPRREVVVVSGRVDERRFADAQVRRRLRLGGERRHREQVPHVEGGLGRGRGEERARHVAADGAVPDAQVLDVVLVAERGGDVVDDGVLHQHPRPVVGAAQPEGDLRVEHGHAVHGGVDVLLEVEGRHVADEPVAEPGCDRVADRDPRAHVGGRGLRVHGVLAGNGTRGEAVLGRRQRRQPDLRALDRHPIPAGLGAARIHLQPVAREGVDLGGANRQVAHGAGHDAMRIGAASGGVERVVQQRAVDEHAFGRGHVDRGPCCCGGPRCCAARGSRRCSSPAPYRRRHTGRRAPGRPPPGRGG